MELKNFKEILLKKAEGNAYLQTLITYAKDDFIIEEVMESLLKMAEPSAAMGRGANHAVTTYGSTMKPVHVEQLRDALGHHISHYASALKAHHESADPEEKKKLRAVADQHLDKIIPMMHLAGRAAKHSHGQLVLDYPSTTPWESNYTTTDRHAHNGKLKEGTKDLGRRPAKSANRSVNVRAVPDYRYLEMAPHPEHAMTEKMQHKGAYPFEEIQLGSPAKRDLGQAYLPIRDVGKVTEYTPHPFDNHPVNKLADHSEKDLLPEHRENFNKEAASWVDTEHHKKWMDNQKSEYQKNPEEYKKRGTTKPAHVFKDIPLRPQPENISATASAAAPAAQETKPAPAAPSDIDISKPPVGADPIVAKHWDSFSDEAKRDFVTGRGKK